MSHLDRKQDVKISKQFLFKFSKIYRSLLENTSNHSEKIRSKAILITSFSPAPSPL